MTTLSCSPAPVTVAEIRQTFLDFFVSKGHTVVPSSPLVPAEDPTLMFTNSGMVQFKDVFLGTDLRDYVRATSVQACLRAGGKHNDLENVGYTARHHTFFEMLGNWSFGDYFKRDSLRWAWEFLTAVCHLPPERLWATVYAEDDEAYDVWTQDIGLPPDRVIRIGDNKGGRYRSDNFWMMADTGPCGPCSEIFYDHGDLIAGGPPGSVDADGDRFIEIWNNVFMQFNMAEDGTVTPLPAPCVDTGMGLERLAAILQNVHSNYDIDLFAALIKAAARDTHTTDLACPSLKVIADHIRAAAFLICDSILPGNEGRGYVLRRIIRRAIRHGYKLGQKTPFLYTLVPDLVDLMGDAYPRLIAHADPIMDVLRVEEERFFETLDQGMQMLGTALGTALAGETRVLAGDVAFKLHDTYGFPLDLTQDVCRERCVTVDVPGFDAAMDQQKAAGRATAKFRQTQMLDYQGLGNAFVGYEQLTCTTTIAAIYAGGVNVDEIAQGQCGVLVLATTPFYGESGGQVGDTGTVFANHGLFDVVDTQRIKSDVWGHHGGLSTGLLRVGDSVVAHVNSVVRRATERNHSATHLMHTALRQVLGEHVHQRGSHVSSLRLRFDFTHNGALTDTEVREVEACVNAEILANNPTRVQVMGLESAQQTGAVMQFGEKYGAVVRVQDIGNSRELCGGTHVRHTGDIGPFKVIAQSGVAAGIRRLEAVTGNNALSHIQQLEDTLLSACSLLKTPACDLASRVISVQDHIKTLEKEVAALKGRLASTQGDALTSLARDVGGVKLLVARLDCTDVKTLRSTLDQLKDRLKTAVIVLGMAQAGKVQLAVGVTADTTARVHAGELVSFLAAQVGGKGGGKADMAMAGGSLPELLQRTLDSVADWVSHRL